MSLVELFCHVDDFCQSFLPAWEGKQLSSGARSRRRATQLCTSEIMTLVIHFHHSRYRDLKPNYCEHVQAHLRSEFPNLVSYARFVALIPRVIGPLMVYLSTLYGQCRGISFVDSTALAVCNNRRIRQHRVFLDLAARGMTSMGWFYGFKLHLTVNDRGELLLPDQPRQSRRSPAGPPLAKSCGASSSATAATSHKSWRSSSSACTTCS